VTRFGGKTLQTATLSNGQRLRATCLANVKVLFLPSYRKRCPPQHACNVLRSAPLRRRVLSESSARRAARTHALQSCRSCLRSTFTAISSSVSQASKRELAQSTREATCSGVSRWAIRLRKSISSPSCCSTMTACCQGISVSNRPFDTQAAEVPRLQSAAAYARYRLCLGGFGLKDLSMCSVCRRGEIFRRRQSLRSGVAMTTVSWRQEREPHSIYKLCRPLQP
jgi:hypothetical protein